ncbi:NADH dehydrogenase [ubiquinone] 1 beta subcomplex subunit 10-like [Nilaparvata lugens]|uniref:NADH dehydrogenase [ubiquinone] 1 beta subcomplex subunit 10-like n=1 Tax=Nilaparvata lugens TaxID=108931 RepID=UPI00193CFB15|nr:NADH dehydrogenase [ubiquinone] 1 beta subcomplex subunit 10-like [Nilaparvata lugens]
MPDVEKIQIPTTESLLVKAVSSFVAFFEAPGDWVRKTIVEPNQKKYPYYHQQFRRVPTIDQCYDDDVICKFEADQQFERDRKVDSQILQILRARVEDCFIYEGYEANEKCKPLQDQYTEASTNWFIKCE